MAANISTINLLIASIIVLSTTIFLRLLYVLHSIRGSHENPHSEGAPYHMIVVLGSGGHTAEMMSLLRDFDPTRYKHRTYIISSGDNFSSNKAAEIEKRIQANKNENFTQATEKGVYDSTTGVWDVKIVPRARKIHQSKLSTPFSASWCLLGCFYALCHSARYSEVTPRQFPSVIITNGPATAVMVIIASIVLKVLAVAPVSTMKTVYVESWARVKTLSLSGKILWKFGLCNKFVVQWEGLAKALNGNGKNKVHYEGFLVD